MPRWGEVTSPPDESTAGKARPARAEPADELERFRDAMSRRLDTLEQLAREQCERLGQGTSERERVLRERVAHLEASHSRLQNELKRREQEWNDTVGDLENDRKLLAEAWERLERERIDGPDAQADPGPAPRARTQNPAGPPAASPAGVLAPEGDDSITRAILWQFQALKDDVRKNAGR